MIVRTDPSTTPRSRRRHCPALTIVVAALLAITVASTAEADGPSVTDNLDSASVADDSASIDARSRGRWRALIVGDFEAAYALELPSYRAVFPLDAFTSQFAADPVWADVRVDEVMMTSEDRAEVRLTIYQTVPLGPGGSRQVIDGTTNEVWLKRDGVWWRALAPLASASPIDSGHLEPPATGSGGDGSAVTIPDLNPRVTGPSGGDDSVVTIPESE